MKFALTSITIIFLTMMFILPVNASERFFRQSHAIEIEVECVDTALNIINELNGHNLEAQVRLQSGWASHGRYWQRRSGNIRRSVDEWAFRHVQTALRALGEVAGESESAVDLRWEIMDLDVRIRSLSTEMERLTLMMAGSTTLNTLIAVNDRLNFVSWERDGLIGRRNLLLSQSRNPVVSITLFEAPVDAPAPVAASFGSRIADSFMNSWANFRRGAENFIVLIARTALPLLIWAVVIVVAAIPCRKIYRKIYKKKFAHWSRSAWVADTGLPLEDVSVAATADDNREEGEGHEEK